MQTEQTHGLGSNRIAIPNTHQPRIVIVGGGFGGLELARKLAGIEAQVVLFDRYNFHTFQPLLYQVATAGLEADSIAGPFRKLFEEQENFYFRLANVQRIDPTERMVHTSIGGLKFDYLILANGAKTNYFGNKELEKHVFPLKQIPHALDLRNRILENFEKAILANTLEERQSLIDFVVVGGGPTGVEVAGALGELKMHVLPHDYPELDFRQMDIHLIEGSPRLLNGMSDKAGQKALEYLKKFQVDVWLNTFVKSYDGKDIVLSNGQMLQSRTVIWAAGVMGDVIEGMPAEAIHARGNRLKVDEYNRVAGTDHVFAIGDVAAMITADTPNGHPMIAPVAMQQGELLANNLRRLLAGRQDLKAFKYFDKGSMATIGRNKAVVDLPGKLRFQGFFAWFVWLFVHLMAIAGYRNRIVILMNWFWNYFTYDRASRLIIKPFVKEKDIELAETTKPV